MDALRIFEFAVEEMEEEEREVMSIRHLRVFRDRTNPLEEYSDVKFIRRYRLSKESFRGLLEMIRNDIEHPTQRNRALLPLEQLTIALRFYACGSFQTVVGDTRGVSQASCCRVVRRVTDAINARKDRFIRFPDNQNASQAVMQGFSNIAGFPGVIGAIDGTHVAIANPGGIAAMRFMNRKRYCSLNCQLVCNHKLQFTNVVSRWYGSAHDSRIFQESRLFRKFEGGEIRGILVGDPAYTCSTYTLTPIRQPATEAERRYNKAQSRTRGAIERAFGIWKKRFHCVGDRNSLRCSLQISMSIVVAAACLHNLALQRNDPLPDDDEPAAAVYLQPQLEANRLEANVRGDIFRQRFIRQHFQ